MAYAFQQGKVALGGAVTSLAIQFNSNVTVNNRVIAGCDGGLAITYTCDDNASGGTNTYTQDQDFNDTNNMRSHVFSAPIVNGGGTKITVTFHASVSDNITGAITEYSGLSTAVGSSAVDAAGTNAVNGVDTGPYPTSATATAAGELVFGYFDDFFTGTVTGSSGTTIDLQGASQTGQVAIGSIASIVGTSTVTFAQTGGNGGGNHQQCVAYKLASGSASAPLPQRRHPPVPLRGQPTSGFRVFMRRRPVWGSDAVAAVSAVIDIATRLRLSAQAFKDLPLRLRLSAQAWKDVPLRLRLSARSWKDIPLRLRLSATAFKDIPLRLRLAVQAFKDIPLRLRLSATAFKDIPLRLRLSATAFKDIPLRLRLAVGAFKDIALRLRLTSTGFKDIPLRVRMSATAFKDIPTRLRLAVRGFKDVPLRVRLSATGFKDIGLRINIAVSAQYKDIPLRLRLSARSFVDIATRLRLAVAAVKDVPTRLRLSARSFKDLSLRLSLAVRGFKDVPLRLRLAASGTKDLALRLRLTAPSIGFRDLGLRFQLVVVGGSAGGDSDPDYLKRWMQEQRRRKRRRSLREMIGLD